MFIRSDRLFLRPGWPEDREELRRRIEPGADLRQPPFAADATQARRFPQFLVTVPSHDGAPLIGCTGLLDGEHGAELVYWIAPEERRQGYATEAARAVLGLARTLGHRLIAATPFADNTASRRVLGKLGFRATGETGLGLCPARGALTPSLVHRRVLLAC